MWFSDISFHSVGLPFHFVDSFFCCAGLLWSHLFILLLFPLPLESDPQKKLAMANVSEFTAFVFKVFYGFSSDIQVFNPFWVNFCVWSFFCMWLSSFPSAAYWRDCHFYILCYLFCNLIVHVCESLCLDSQFCVFDLCVCFCSSTILFGLL